MFLLPWRSGEANFRFFFLKDFCWSFSGFIDSTAEDCDRKQGKRGGVTRSKGTRAGSRTPVHRRASAHGSRTTDQAKRRPKFSLLEVKFSLFLWFQYCVYALVRVRKTSRFGPVLGINIDY